MAFVKYFTKLSNCLDLQNPNFENRNKFYNNPSFIIPPEIEAAEQADSTTETGLIISPFVCYVIS